MTADEFIAQYNANRASAGVLPRQNQITNGYSDQVGVQAPAQSQGWLADLLGGMINPFVNLGKIGLEGAAKGFSMLQGKDPSAYKPMFQTPSEYYRVQENPVQTGLGAAATLGSLLIPGGSGVTGMALQGAKSGALFGGGQQLMSDKNDVGSVLNSALTGGLTGGAVGGGLGLAGKVIGGIKAPKTSGKTITQVESKMLEQQPDLANLSPANRAFVETISPSYYGMIKETNPFAREADVQIAMADALKFNKGTAPITGKVGSTPTGTNAITPGGFEKSLQLMADNLKTTAAEIANGIKGPFMKKADFIATIDDAIKNFPGSEAGAIRSELMPIINGYGTKLTTADALSLGMKVNEFAAGIGKKNMTDSLMSGVQQASQFVNGQLKKLYSLNPETQGLLPIFDRMTVYNKVKPGVFKYSTSSPTMWTMNIPLAQKYVAVPARIAAGGVKALGTKITGGNGLGVGGLLGAIKNAPTPTINGAPIPAGIFGAIRGSQSAKQPVSLNMNSDQMTTPADALGTTSSAAGISETDTGRQQIMNLLSSGMKPSDVKIVAELLGYTTPKTSAKALSANQVSAKSGLKSIADIKNLLPKAGNFSLITPYFLKSSEGKQLTTAISNASDAIARLRTGAAINDKELELYQGMLPQLTDDSDTVKYKLDSLSEIFNNLLQNTSGSDQLKSSLQTILAQ